MKVIKPSFYVLYPKNDRLRKYLNSIKILCDYTQRTEAHITVRGPYKNKLGNDIIENYNNIISGELLNITDVENFFPFNQNTVYFKCEDNSNLRKVWNKITYNDFKPHITMYDGKNLEFAIKLFGILAKDFKPFFYEVDSISYLEPKNKDTLGIFSLTNKFDFTFFHETLNINIKLEDIKKMSEEKRLILIELVLEKLFKEFNQYQFAK